MNDSAHPHREFFPKQLLAQRVVSRAEVAVRCCASITHFADESVVVADSRIADFAFG